MPYDATGPVDAPNPASCTCPSGDGSLRHPCPAHPATLADECNCANGRAEHMPSCASLRATLADVQHGGRVRLGDQAERAQFEAWAHGECLSLHKWPHSGEYSDDRTSFSWKAWNVVLATQPAPGIKGALAALQHDYDKLLATAKHGGCVQLPTSERERFEAWCTSQRFPMRTNRMPTDDNEYRSLKTREAWRVWQAALSAQPSPGGQGDAPDIEQLQQLVSNILSTVSLGHQTGPYAYAGEDFGGYLREAASNCREIMRGLSALAARQPVGEPVAFRVRYLSGKTGEVIETGKWCDAPVPSFIDESATLFCGNTQRLELAYPAPPAQAEDLEQFREAVVQAISNVRYMTGGGPAHAKLVELLALIDNPA